MPVAPYHDKYFLGRYGDGRLKYPNPFFDMSQQYIPKSIKTLFKYCRTFFYRNGFLHSVVTKLTEYPITDLLFEKQIPKDVKSKYEDLLNHYIRLKTLLIQIGLDYFTYGNCFISAYMKFDRYLKCPKCGHEHPIKDVKYKWTNYKFMGSCSACNSGQTVTFEIVDKYLQKKEYLRFNRWAPENIDLDWDPISGDTDYYYQIPADIKKKIQSGDKKTLQRVPKIFIDALREKKKIELDKNNLYHFKRPTLAEDDAGWGKPLILSAMQDIWYLQHLRRGNEAIATEHIIPFRILYPSSQGNIDPYTQMNLNTWRGRLEGEIELWKQDPNHISIFPIPIGQMNLGGDGKLLTVTQEMKFIEESIITSMGVPVEFIKGGASWSGSSISLRIIENHFLNYRALLEDFINYFLVVKIESFLKYPNVKMKFKRLRMADDTETKRIAIELAAQNKLSTARLLDDFGYDFEEERENIKNSYQFEAQIAYEQSINQAEAAGKAMEIQARSQVRAQHAAADEQAKLREEVFKQELANEAAKSPLPGGENMDVSSLINRFTEEILLMPSNQAEKVLEDLAKKMPYTHAMILRRIQEQQIAEISAAAQMGMPIEPSEEESGNSGGSESKPGDKKKRKPEAEKKKQGASKNEQDK